MIIGCYDYVEVTVIWFLTSNDISQISEHNITTPIYIKSLLTYIVSLTYIDVEAMCFQYRFRGSELYFCVCNWMIWIQNKYSLHCITNVLDMMLQISYH